MKKLLFLLLLITSVSYGQAIAPTRVKITNNAISTTAPFIAAQETDGFVNKINKSDLIEVIEISTASAMPVTGLAGKIYVTLDNNRLYRWTGTIYQDLGYVDISNKVDKVTGKSLISDAEITRLATLANYTHPANHPPSIITQDGSNRFVTDAEKTAWNAKQSALGFTAENSENKNNANGYAGLDSAGKVPLSQINDALLGSVNFKGTFNAATNVPAIPTATSSNKGWYYTVSTGGSQQGLNLVNGDWIISNGVIWAKVDNNNSVTSVAGKVGSVSLVKSDVGLSNVDNTSDLLKPISTATATAIATKVSSAGTTNFIQKSTGTGTQGNSAMVDNGSSVTSSLPLSVTGAVTGTSIVKSGATATNLLLAGGTDITQANLPISTATQTALNLKENSFTKNSAFNTNFGNTAGTTAQGNDSRINNGQTAYAWGNHASKYPLFDGTGAYGSWGINISGNAGTATTASNSTLWDGYSNLFSQGVTDNDISSIVGFHANGYAYKISPTKVKEFLGLGSSAYLNADISSTANTLVQRSNDGLNMIKAGYLEMNQVGIDTTPINEFVTIGGGSVLRRNSIASVKSYLGLGSNAYSSTAYLPINDGARVSLDYNTKLTSGFYNSADMNINNPSGQGYSQLIVARGLDTGLQIAGGFNTDNLHFRGWLNSGANFTPWRKIWHDGNFNPDNYLPLTGGVVTGNVTAPTFISPSNSNPVTINTESFSIQQGYNASFISAYRTGGIKTELYVNATKAEFSNNVNILGTTTASGGFFQSSDRRLKNVFKRDGDVAYFKWKDNRDNDTHIGYIAQEVKREFPNQVKADEKGMLSVNYIEVLVAKVQALEKRITELEKSK